MFLYSMTLSKIIYPGMLMTYNCMEIAFQPTECEKKYVRVAEEVCLLVNVGWGT